ncbi:MAG: ABC-F family ATP-binding cassette domain-containing protein [Verrucomicrobiae bacterium]|nr:ABC-F family ATP-binding cassette domain-containing protein [Verrucomicrobiae bacterium]
MLTLAGITKTYGGRTLFREATLCLNAGDRVGLVGPNGAGKTTLFRILLGEESPDAGEITCQRGLRIGYLPQENAPTVEGTVLELATAISKEYAELRRRLRDGDAAPQEIAAVGDDDHARFEELGGYRVEVKARKMLLGLGFRERDFERPLRELSGGWVMRAHLARLLVMEPDLLLLDEPTNHLDLESLLWFQEYLKTFSGAILMTSHDREFLNQLAGAIVEIRQERLIRYTGNYDAYVAQRQAAEEQLLAAYKNQQREIARLMAFVERFRAKNTKATQAQSKLKQIERMEKIAAPVADDPELDFQFPQPERSGQRVIELKGVRHAYGEQLVYADLNFVAERGQRIVLVGPNGAGKSTLLKLLAGVLPVQAGERVVGYRVRVGYYAQYRTEMLQPGRTVLEEALDTPQRVTEQYVRTVLGGFRFSGDDVFKPVSVLSGGEKSRLALVKLLLDPPNLLLMDEPTTHLDMASTDALLAALDQFEGTLIFISHDVYFIRSLARQVVRVEQGRLSWYAGGYDYYLEKWGEQRLAAVTADGEKAGGNGSMTPPRAADVRREQRRLAAELRNVRSRALRAQRQRVKELEEQITALESRQAELTRLLEDPATYGDSARTVAINRELQELVARLPGLHGEWEQEALKLHAMETEPDGLLSSAGG